MIFRFWGDTHADVQQFAPLVDRRAGGIADNVLVEAIRSRGWAVAQPRGSLAALRSSIERGAPAILLVEDRPARFHYVVAVGLTSTEVILHDPTWGPSRRLPVVTLQKIWEKSGLWMAVITPGDRRERPAVPRVENEAAGAAAALPKSACDRRLDTALDEIARGGLAVADQALGSVHTACPQMAAPLTELAGVRFKQSRWTEAATLATEALHLAPTDRYTWDLLGSSRFLAGDVNAALSAWNEIDRPTLDSVQIEGLQRARYAHIASVMGLTPNTLLTPRDYALAARRLEDLPDRSTSRLALRPAADGYATVTATVRETTLVPSNLAAWGVAGVQAAFDREVIARIGGRLGQGELWTASWRWWENRPRVAASFAAPMPGAIGGVWRVEGFWEAQTYRTEAIGEVRQTQRAARLSWGRWLAPNLRAEVRSGVDAWNPSQRAALVGASLEQRLLRDRLSFGLAVDRWGGLGSAASFATTALTASARSSVDPVGLVAIASARAHFATEAAPLALWYGAGEGRARPGLLRAHRLFHDGIIDGAVFGRQVTTVNTELQRWFTTRIAPVAVAVFADVGHAAHRLPGAAGEALAVDAGFGVRARAPGLDGVARLDYARGLRDGRQRVTAGWTVGLR